MRSLKSEYVRDVLLGIPAVSSLLDRILVEKALTEKEEPYLYISKVDLHERHWLYKKTNVTMSIVAGETYTETELAEIFDVIDDEICPSIDGCLPVIIWGNVTVIHIEQWSMYWVLRDVKWNAVLRKTYIFTYLIRE